MHPWFGCSSLQEKSSLAQKSLLLPEREYDLLSQLHYCRIQALPCFGKGQRNNHSHQSFMPNLYWRASSRQDPEPKVWQNQAVWQASFSQWNEDGLETLTAGFRKQPVSWYPTALRATNYGNFISQACCNTAAKQFTSLLHIHTKHYMYCCISWHCV